MVADTSPAVIFRGIGKNPPTLLVDEADTIFGPKAGEKEDLRGLLNAGHQRNRPAWRISGPEHKPTAFPTFAMAALAGIGDLPDTIMDRAVVIRIQKRKSGERLTPFRTRDSVPELNALRDRLTFRAALPDHADRVLADPAWAALTTTLARAETAGHNPRHLLATVGAQRELDSADRPAEVLDWRITAQPNRRAQAACRRSTVSGTSSMSATPHPPATPVAMRPGERSQHR